MSLFRPVERRDVFGSPTYNPFDNPAVPLQSVAFDSVYGIMNRQNNNSGENVTVDKALALPTVWRCIGLLSTVIAGCPLQVYNKKKDPIVVPALDPQNTSTTYTPYELWELVVAHVALWGNAFVLKVRNQAGGINDLKPITPSLVQVTLGQVDAKHTDGKYFKVEQWVDGKLLGYKTYGNWDVMHIPGLGYNGLFGLSPLQVAAQTYGTAMAADKLAARFFSNGTQLSGIIKVKAPLADQTQADELKRRWRMVNSGSGHSGDVAVMDAETDWQPLTIPPDQLQFLESREWEVSELARMYGVPPHLIGDESKSTSWGTGIEQQNIGFVAYTIAGWTSRFEQRITREVVNTRGQYASFDLTELMKGSTSERFSAYALGIQWGWLTRNEARAREDMAPLPGLDKPLTPLNMLSGNAQTEAVDPNVVPMGPDAPVAPPTAPIAPDGTPASTGSNAKAKDDNKS
jgi:HK97 family phage portal protein